VAGGPGRSSTVTFQVRRGESVGIIGRNGSGKSTLLQIVAGTMAPSTGHAVTRGRIAALLELGSGFNPEFTGRENVHLNCLILGLSREDVDRRMDEILAFADIGDFVDQPVKTYSSGMFLRILTRAWFSSTKRSLSAMSSSDRSAMRGSRSCVRPVLPYSS
jgi:ABC-type polysaccharide/polyol phosphate transport system ATPase subunit